MDLFAHAGDERARARAPLADRIRPSALEDVVGQEHLVGPNGPLRRAIEGDRVPSLILYGPPGTGKTTLARIIIASSGAYAAELSAVTAGKADVMACIADARDRLGQTGRRTILFLDEIHRFNKAQQDALLPAVESGILTLIGATTENPYAELNAALLSRCALFELQALDDEALRTVIGRAAEHMAAELDAKATAALVRAAGGDARTGVATFVLAHETAVSREVAIDESVVAEAAVKRPLAYAIRGDSHFDTISALIKSMRGSDPDAAIYWLAVMIAGGEDARYIVRRLIVFASEDVGNADPRALGLAIDAAEAIDRIGMPEGRICLAQAVTYLALAPKSNAGYLAIDAALALVRREGGRTPPNHIRDSSHASRKLGRGTGYRYPHDEGGFADGQSYLPPEVEGTRFYEPREVGFEARLASILGELRGGGRRGSPGE